jgi:hypothetical protein
MPDIDKTNGDQSSKDDGTSKVDGEKVDLGNSSEEPKEG